MLCSQKYSSSLRLALFWLLLLSAQQPTSLIDYKIVGTDTLRLHMFDSLPDVATEPRPAIVFFFGGGWVSGHPLPDSFISTLHTLPREA